MGVFPLVPPLVFRVPAPPLSRPRRSTRGPRRTGRRAPRRRPTLPCSVLPNRNLRSNRAFCGRYVYSHSRTLAHSSVTLFRRGDVFFPSIWESSHERRRARRACAKVKEPLVRDFYRKCGFLFPPLSASASIENSYVRERPRDRAVSQLCETSAQALAQSKSTVVVNSFTNVKIASPGASAGFASSRAHAHAASSDHRQNNICQSFCVQGPLLAG